MRRALILFAIVAATVGLSMIAVGLFALSHDEVARVASPGAVAEAVVVESNRVATTSYGYDVVVVPHGAGWKRVEAVAHFNAATRKPTVYGVTQRWRSGDSLVVEYWQARDARLDLPTVRVGDAVVHVTIQGGIMDSAATAYAMLGLPGVAVAAVLSPGAPAAQPAAADGLASFKAWLDREHPGYGCDEGPAWFRSATVDAAYPGRRFCFVLTHARGIPPPFPKPLTLIARIDDDGAIAPLNATSPQTFQPGLIKVTSVSQARRAAAAVLILAMADPGQRRWKIEPGLVRARRTRDGWMGTCATPDRHHVSEVRFDRRGMLTSIACNTPPVP